MKKILNKLIRNEEGQALVLALVLLLVGGLLITPLMAFMSTGLKVGQAYEERMAELYAADAGVEDALWNLRMNSAELPQTTEDDPWQYNIADVNGKDVDVEIVMEEDVEEFLKDLLEENYSGTHADWTVISDIVEDGTYTITITYNGAAEKKSIDGIGAWLMGDYDIKYEDSEPVYGGMTDDYPDYSFEVVPYKGGTAFLWGWTGSDKPEFGKKTGVYTRFQTFEFTPQETPGFYISWVITSSADIGVVTSDVTFEILKVTATATDLSTSKQTDVIAYISRYGDEVGIVTWEIILQ